MEAGLLKQAPGSDHAVLRWGEWIHANLHDKWSKEYLEAGVARGQLGAANAAAGGLFHAW